MKQINKYCMIALSAQLIFGCGAKPSADATLKDTPATTTPVLVIKQLDESWAPQWLELVALYHLNETSTGSASAGDDFINSITAIESGYVAGSALAPGNSNDGPLDHALSFNGVDDVVRLRDSSSINALTDTIGISVMAWVKTLGQPVGNWSGYGIIYSAHNQSMQLEISLDHPALYSPGGDLVCDGTGGSTDISLNNGAWHHVVAVWDAGTTRVYADGVLCATGAATISTYVGSIENQIGAEGAGGTDEHFPGSIDEIAVWKKALTDSEILAIYNHQKP